MPAAVEPIVVVLSSVINAQGEKSATLTLYPRDEGERVELLDMIVKGISEDVALNITRRDESRRIIVNPAHIMYAE